MKIIQFQTLNMHRNTQSATPKPETMEEAMSKIVQLEEELREAKEEIELLQLEAVYEKERKEELLKKFIHFKIKIKKLSDCSL